MAQRDLPGGDEFRVFERARVGEKPIEGGPMPAPEGQFDPQVSPRQATVMLSLLQRVDAAEASLRNLLQGEPVQGGTPPRLSGSAVADANLLSRLHPDREIFPQRTPPSQGGREIDTTVTDPLAVHLRVIADILDERLTNA